MRISSRPGGRQSGAVSRFSGALVLGVLLVVGVGQLGLAQLNADIDRLAHHNVATIAATADLSSAVAAVEEAALAQLTTTDAAGLSQLDEQLDRTAIPRLRKVVAALRILGLDDPESGPALDGLQSGVDRYQRLRAAVDRRGGSGPAQSPAARAELVTQVRTLFEGMRESVDSLRGDELVEVRESTAEAAATYRSTRALLLGGAGAALLGGLVVILLLARRGEAARLRDADQAEFADTLQATVTEDEAHDLVQRQLQRSLPGTVAVVLKRNNSENRLEAATAVSPDSVLAGQLVGAEPRSCLALRFGHTHREDRDRPPLVSCQLCGGGETLATCEPLLVGGQVIGSVVVTHQEPLDAEQDLRIRSSVAQAAPVLANLRNLALAEFRANNDSLTGLPNKRATDDTLKRMVAQANRSVTPLSAAMLDLDHFKQVNDRFGHAKGDEVLAAVGAAVRSCLRASDFAGRYGGEELLVLMPETAAAEAFIVAERIRAAVATVTVLGVERDITVSIGIADLIQHGGDTPGLLRQADRALYAAKAAGRNRTVTASGDASVLGTSVLGTSVLGTSVLGTSVLGTSAGEPVPSAPAAAAEPAARI